MFVVRDLLVTKTYYYFNWSSDIITITLCSRVKNRPLTLIGVHGYSGNVDATAHAPNSLVHFVKPIKNSRPKINSKFCVHVLYVDNKTIYLNQRTNTFR